MEARKAKQRKIREIHQWMSKRRNFVDRTKHVTSEPVFERRLREDVIGVCNYYLNECRSRWTQLGHNDARAKMDIADDLLLSAQNDNFDAFSGQIVSSIQWLDRNNHNSTMLRKPFEQYNEAMRSREIIAYRR